MPSPSVVAFLFGGVALAFPQTLDMGGDVPTIEEVVRSEGFTPTPSQSDIYRPGAVLVSNGRGGHDVVIGNCIAATATISQMSQSSIATTLSGGVSARLRVVRGAVDATIQRRLSFVDPEQRTLGLGHLRPTPACADAVRLASGLRDLSDAVLIHDVLVAVVKNTVCTRLEAEGQVVVLGEAEAERYTECIMESNGQVPLGFKAVPLERVLAVALDNPRVSQSTANGAPPGRFEGVDEGLDVDARLQERECNGEAAKIGAALRERRLEEASQAAVAEASAAWHSIEGELSRCTGLRATERTSCIAVAERWLEAGREMRIVLPAGFERVETSCGEREEVFGALSRVVGAREIVEVERLLGSLRLAGLSFEERDAYFAGMMRSPVADQVELFRLNRNDWDYSPTFARLKAEFGDSWFIPGLGSDQTGFSGNDVDQAALKELRSDSDPVDVLTISELQNGYVIARYWGFDGSGCFMFNGGTSLFDTYGELVRFSWEQDGFDGGVCEGVSTSVVEVAGIPDGMERRFEWSSPYEGYPISRKTGMVIVGAPEHPFECPVAPPPSDPTVIRPLWGSLEDLPGGPARNRLLGAH